MWGPGGRSRAGGAQLAVQVVAFALLGYFYLKVLPGWLGLRTVGLELSIWRIAETVAIFLGIPLVAGYLTRTIGERRRDGCGTRPSSSPHRPFASTGCCTRSSSSSPPRPHDHVPSTDVARIALPLLAYFAIMWFGTFAYGRAIGLPYERTATLSFTAAGNNFELAIAVAIGVFGVTSGEALAGVVGPLIEVPVLVGLVYVSLWARVTTRRGHATHDGRSPVSDKPVVLFLCIHNSGRSLAARVLLDHYAEGRVRVESAGSEPGDQLNPSVIAILEERGLDVSKEFPKPLTDALGREADVIVTMGCGDTCPVYRASVISTGARRPCGKPIDEVRPIIDDIDDGFVRSWSRCSERLSPERH